MEEEPNGRTETGRAARRAARRPFRLGELLGPDLRPALRRRGFASADLVLRWAEIVGPNYARSTIPDRLAWPRLPKGVAAGDDGPEPAVLHLRCTGAVAVRVSHDAPVLVERINSYFGFQAVSRIRILQSPMRLAAPARVLPPAPLDRADAERIERLCAGIGNEGLRKAAAELGESVRKSRRDAGSP